MQLDQISITSRCNRGAFATLLTFTGRWFKWVHVVIIIRESTLASEPPQEIILSTQWLELILPYFQGRERQAPTRTTSRLRTRRGNRITDWKFVHIMHFYFSFFPRDSFLLRFCAFCSLSFNKIVTHQSFDFNLIIAIFMNCFGDML